MVDLMSNTADAADFAPGTILTIKVQRLSVYASNQPPSDRTSSKIVTVRRVRGNGRYLVQIHGKDLEFSFASLDVAAEMTGSGSCGRRPYRYLVIDVQIKKAA